MEESVKYTIIITETRTDLFTEKNKLVEKHSRDTREEKTDSSIEVSLLIQREQNKRKT